jgi:Flp pilus assembly protein TadD
VESVAWVAERKDVLSTFFLLLSLGAYTRYAQSVAGGQGREAGSSAGHTSRWYWLSLVWFALGLMSKPMVVTLPFILLLLDYWPLRRFQVSGFRFQVFLEKVPFLALSFASCVVTFVAQQGSQAVMSIKNLPVAVRIENSVVAYGGYLEKMVWPDGLAVFYPLTYPIEPDKLVVPIILLLGISGVVFFLRRQKPYLVTGWLWYLGTLVPVIGLVQVGGQSMADRYSYVPLIGIFIAVVWLVAEISGKWPQRRLVLTGLSIGVLAAGWSLTAVQVGYWQNSETLARHALAVTDHNGAMEILLGNALSEQGKTEAASEHYANAVRIWPDSVTAQCDLAMSLAAQGRNAEAVDGCRALLEIRPHEIRIHNLLGNLLLRQGRWAEAMAEYRAALQIDPDFLMGLNNLAWLRATAPEARFRDGTEAVRLAEKACHLTDYQLTVYVGTLAAAYAEAGRFEDAVKTAQKAVALATTEKNSVMNVADDMGQVQIHAAPVTVAKKLALIKKNRELLELYQQHKAYHEP